MPCTGRWQYSRLSDGLRTYAAVPSNRDRLHILAEVVGVSIGHGAFSCPGEAVRVGTAGVELVVREVHRLADGATRHLTNLWKRRCLSN